jgi:hypothetical protein
MPSYDQQFPASRTRELATRERVELRVNLDSFAIAVRVIAIVSLVIAFVTILALCSR